MSIGDLVATELHIEMVFELPGVIWIEGTDHRPAIRSMVRRQGRLWAFGQHVLLGSPNGTVWNDEARNLRREGSFNVCAIAESEDGLQIFARNRNGLNCYRLDPWTSAWEFVVEIQSGSPCVSAAWTGEGLVLALRTGSGTETRGFDSNLRQKWSSFLPGLVEHWQLTEAGIGLCGVWDGDPGAPQSWSEVYSTTNYGRSWTLVGRIPEMLLAGASVSPTGALLGGGDGVLVSIADGQVSGEWREAGGDVVAVDCEGGTSLSVVEPEVIEEVHRFLFRLDGGDWTAVEAHFGKRISAVKLLRPGEFLISAEDGIYRCRRRLAVVG